MQFSSFSSIEETVSLRQIRALDDNFCDVYLWVLGLNEAL